jgi:putative peptide zinc metalloprotease protein
LHGVEFSGFDRIVQALNRLVGGILFTTPAAIAVALVATAGLVAFAAQAIGGDRLTVSATAPVVAVVVLRTFGLLSVGPHECGHALVTAHNKRHIGKLGVGFYWGALTFYVDASQALFLPRRTRMLQAAAGVITDLVLCGMASIIAWGVGGHATWILVVREFAVLGYLNVIANAAPLLELDGYWFLADALDRPTLQRDARKALTEAVHHRPYSRRLAAYAVISLVFGVLFVAIGLVAWWALFGGLFLELWRGGVGYKALAIYLILPFIPMFIHLSVQLLRFLRRQQDRPVSTVAH